MGYGFICRHRKTDENSIFFSECQYAYNEIFDKAFGIKVQEFSGRVTKAKIEQFKKGVEFLKTHRYEYLNTIPNYRGYLANRNYDGVIEDFEKIVELMESKQVGYLSIG